MISCSKRRLFIDLETFSSVDISSAGAFRYTEAPDFEILLIAYAWDDEPVQVLDLTSGTLHVRAHWANLKDALRSPSVVKVAHNCAFERAALSRYIGRDLPPEEWEDTMVLAAYNGLPLSLDGAGAALGLRQQKIKEGAALIRYFCQPCKPTKANGQRSRNRPEHAPDKWARFVEYCGRDVEVAQAIYKRLGSFPVTPFERRIWALDARINERGVLVDLDLARAAVAVDEAFTAELMSEMKKLTGLENPNSVAQLKGWLEGCGHFSDSLAKAAVSDMLAEASDPVVARVLRLRQMLGKTSTTKYGTMLAAAGSDDRMRGLTQYYGAARTGRWAGRLVQLQNLPQNHLDAIGAVRELVRSRDLATLEMIYDDVPDVLSQLIRTALVAKPGHTFLVADFSAIEARVIAWMAGEQWRQDVFASGGDIYCSSASQMFKVPVEKHGVNGHLRQKGKVAELACGYGGGVNALIAFGADKMGLSPEEMQDIVTQWRAASPSIPKFWRDTEAAAKLALENPGKKYRVPCGVEFRKDADALRLLLPSGRWLTYWGARLENGSIVYMGQGSQGGWLKKDTWGGKLVENIVQAVARDCLAVAMDRLDAAGFEICFHVHDEVVAEAPEGSRWEDMAEIMGRPIEWAPGLLLRADGYDTKFYRKD
ncbi:MAG: DNA polymerase [Rikenellaceae bacterium]|nr:DNA polymerase [Rikenellaceae bacterium]